MNHHVYSAIRDVTQNDRELYLNLVKAVTHRLSLISWKTGLDFRVPEIAFDILEFDIA